jgi:ABC-type glycerol-3-phosphate transport system permease component
MTTSAIPFGRYYLNSIVVTVAVTVLRILISSLAAYAFARLRFRGKNLLFLLFMATMMITPEATLVPRYLLYKSIRLIDSQWAIIVPAVFDVFFLFMLRQFFMTIPRELSEAAYLDGYGHLRIWWRIVLPLAKPALVTMALFTFIWIWNDYANPFVFINSMKKQLITTGLVLPVREGQLRPADGRGHLRGDPHGHPVRLHPEILRAGHRHQRDQVVGHGSESNRGTPGASEPAPAAPLAWRGLLPRAVAGAP